MHYKPLYAAIGAPDNRHRRRVAIVRTTQRLMILDAVLADRSVTWLGSEHEKRRSFMKRLGDSLRDNEYPRLVFGGLPNVTVRYFPDKLPIGDEPDCYRHVFLYLALSPSPMNFRVFVLRHLEKSIDLTSDSRQRDKLREELTLAQIDRHTEEVDELTVEGILAFAERILPRASDDLRVQASLDYKQRLQQLFFPEGIAYDGNRFNRTAATAPLFNYLAPSDSADEKMVTRIFTSWNQMSSWLSQLQDLKRAA